MSEKSNDSQLREANRLQRECLDIAKTCTAATYQKIDELLSHVEWLKSMESLMQASVQVTDRIMAHLEEKYPDPPCLENNKQ